MIYTVTLNPSIDYLMHPKRLEKGGLNRSGYENHTYGGKGINVSAMLTNLGMENTALGFVGGYSGGEIERLCVRAGIKCDFCRICDPSRINVKIISDCETEVNGAGPMIRFEEENKLLKKLNSLSDEDTVILSGSAPESESGRLLENIIEAVSHMRFIADMSGSALCTAIEKKPYLIKPNIKEICEIFGTENCSINEAAQYALQLCDRGVKNVAVSLGEAGALLATQDGKVYRMRAPEIEVKSTVGAGDSFLAGFLAGEYNSPQFALALGVAAGSATASCDGIADGVTVMNVFSQM